MKILIIGGSGTLGQYLNIYLSKEHEILSIYKNEQRNCRDFNSLQIDITDHNRVKEVFNSFKPDAVVHTAAISTPIIPAGLSAKDIYAVNVNAAKNIAQLCEQIKAKLIYTSTDLVYAGYRGSMLKEDAKLIPVSIYAESKLMGEMKIIENTKDYIILRTALLYGFGLNGSKIHFHFMYNELKINRHVKLFHNQYRTPLSLLEAARIISELIKKDISGEIINFGGIERVSRYELGEILCEEGGFDKSLLDAVSMDDVPELPKVEDVSMNTEKLQSFGINQRSIRESMREIMGK